MRVFKLYTPAEAGLQVGDAVPKFSAYLFSYRGIHPHTPEDSLRLVVMPDDEEAAINMSPQQLSCWQYGDVFVFRNATSTWRKYEFELQKLFHIGEEYSLEDLISLLKDLPAETVGHFLKGPQPLNVPTPAPDPLEAIYNDFFAPKKPPKKKLMAWTLSKKGLSYAGSD